MTHPITRGEFCRRWLVICLTSAIFAGLMYAYDLTMRHVFARPLSDAATNFVIACALNLAAFAYIRWAVIPRMRERGKGILYAVLMHLPLLTHVNAAIIVFDLKAVVILDDALLNALGLAGAALAGAVFFEAAYLPGKTAPTADRP